MSTDANCDHFWETVEELGYGWVSICQDCNKRESAEHSDDCMFGLQTIACICGAEKEFQEYEARQSR